ncbi:hypothetical protein [Malaciobacter marinus]|nr:hypothetical protein [Malaciobacter marinus]
MHSKEYKFYGLIGGDLEIMAKITMACKVISPKTEQEAKLLLAETIAVESRNGKATDYSKEYGEGLTQFDRPTFTDVKNHFMANIFKELRQKIKNFLGVDIAKVQYTDLRKSPMTSIVFARLLYFRVPAAIPKTKIGRWQYYKKYFNSVLGATTQSKYYNAMEYAVFKDNNPNMVG